jgi:hypothetical protein
MLHLSNIIWLEDAKKRIEKIPTLPRVLREAIISVSELQHALMDEICGCKFMETMMNVYCNQC